ncbi:hypothetical protein, partial [Kurthia massiliensis]|uniref:hypothetical protein n=1 Tax=Kurthia massiliensis TaxID=1033739 RepID=UPI000287B407
ESDWNQSLQAAIVPLKANDKTIGVLYMTAPDNYISTLVSNIIQRFTIIIAIILVFVIAEQVLAAAKQLEIQSVGLD